MNWGNDTYESVFLEIIENANLGDNHKHNADDH